MSGLKGFSSRKSQFVPLGEAQTRLSVPKEARALVLINWMAFHLGLEIQDQLIKVSIRVARALTLGLTETEIMLYIALCSSLCNMNAVESPPKLSHS